MDSIVTRHFFRNGKSTGTSPGDRSPRFLAVLALAAITAVLLMTAQSAHADTSDDDNTIDITPDSASEYKDCLLLAERRPDQAVESAVAWEKQGGGDPARHCKALALINLDRPEDGALELERIAQTLPQEKAGIAADLFGQAGQAWVKAGKSQLALHDQNEGLKLQPKNVDLLIDRAMTYGNAGMYGDAATDLTTAAGLAKDRPMIFALRAAAYRHLDNKAGALNDAETALRLSPDFPLALLERGKLRLLKGDKDGARQDWLKIVTKAPNTAAADEAQRDIEQIDLNPDALPAQ
jgi:tetratricopeptide (TPR) repeat protein